jgi:hypothetical protein
MSYSVGPYGSQHPALHDPNQNVYPVSGHGSQYPGNFQVPSAPSYHAPSGYAAPQYNNYTPGFRAPAPAPASSAPMAQMLRPYFLQQRAEQRNSDYSGNYQPGSLFPNMSNVFNPNTNRETNHSHNSYNAIYNNQNYYYNTYNSHQHYHFDSPQQYPTGNGISANLNFRFPFAR